MSEDRCCCGVCHVKTGTWISAILQFVFGIAEIVLGIVSLVRSQEGSTDEASFAVRYVVITYVMMAFLWLLTVVLLMFGLHKNKPNLILPHLVLTVIDVMLIVAASIWLVVTGLPIFLAILVACMVLIEFGLLWVERQCYKYISSIA